MHPSVCLRTPSPHTHVVAPRVRLAVRESRPLRRLAAVATSAQEQRSEDRLDRVLAHGSHLR
jgi:hypothetical protein